MTSETVRSREAAALWFAVLATACGAAPMCYLSVVAWAPSAVRRHTMVDLLGPVAMCGAPLLSPLLGLAAVAAGVGAWRGSRALTGQPSMIGGSAAVLGITSVVGAVGLALLLLVGPAYRH